MFTFCPSSVWSKSVITINLLGPAWRSSFTSCVKPELKREPAGAAAIRGAKGLMASRTLQTLDVKWDFWSPREFQAIGQSQHLFQGMKHHRKTGSTNWRLRSSDNQREKKNLLSQTSFAWVSHLQVWSLSIGRAGSTLQTFSKTGLFCGHQITRKYAPSLTARSSEFPRLL